ncbi:MAG: PAS domain S-box protein [Deltaproteobacteria bacterium]|nr:PAS domain S-box protein [Deltaproteobacteria bacterium]
MFLRVIFVSVLLGATIVIQIKETKTEFGDIQSYHYLLITSIYLLTLIYAVLLKRLKSLTAFAYGQIVTDTVVVTAIIYTTGGIESIFSFLYLLTIINGSIILYRKGGMVTASCCSILYGLLLDLHYYDLITPLGGRVDAAAGYQSSSIFYLIAVNIAAFYLVAFLSSYPSELARKSRVELKAKQADIAKLEALNERIIQSITSGLITLNQKGSVILFNPGAEEIFGLKSAEAIGRNLGEVVPFLYGRLEGNGVNTSSGKGRTGGFIDFPFVRRDGIRLFLRCSVSPLAFPEGGESGRILFFQDMTELRRIEEEMKRVEGLALTGQLAAAIAHEIRNPMASISGSIQMLKESLDMDDVRNRLMDIVLREINRLNSLIGDFLVFARPRQAVIEEFDLNRLIKDSLELFKNSKKWTGGIMLETNFAEPLKIRSDPGQLRQILWNLFHNAVDAMAQGGTLHVSAGIIQSRDNRGALKDMAQITIRDTGAGFSKKALQNLFTPFFTTKEGGSGLGLATVRRIVEGLRGSITGCNHPEGGAEVTICLDPFPQAPA